MEKKRVRGSGENEKKLTNKGNYRLNRGKCMLIGRRTVTKKNEEINGQCAFIYIYYIRVCT